MNFLCVGNENLGDSLKYSCLSEKSCKKCIQAYSVLEILFKLCESCSVTLKEIPDLEKNKDKLLELYSVCSSTTVHKRLVQNKKSFEHKLDQCFTLANNFLHVKSLLSLFCAQLIRIRMPIEGKKYYIDFSLVLKVVYFVIGLSALEKHVGNNYELCCVNKLCTVHDGVLHVIPFQGYNNIMSILEDFNSLFKIHESDFVRHFFVSLVRNLIKSTGKVNLENFVEIIWKPFFNKCCLFINSIRDSSIKLKEIDEIENHCTRFEKLEGQLLKLVCGLEVCQGLSSSTVDHSWISKPINQIQTYISLCKQAKAAHMVLQIKEKLELTGDFNIVEHVAHKVSETMQDQPLSSIDISVGAVASFLKDMASNKKKSDCIEVFSNCLDIVTWMKKGKSDLHNDFFFKYIDS